MGEGTGAARAESPVVDRIAEHGRKQERGRADEIEGFLRAYYAHVDAGDLESRRVEDLFGMATGHEQLGMDREPGSVAIELANPRVETEGWGSDHTVVMIVTDDIPFLVDSVTMALSRLQIGIHLVVHPVLRDRRSDGGRFADLDDEADESSAAVSFIAVEVDRTTEADQLAEIEDNLRRVLGDVRAAVADWSPMRARMEEIAASVESLPSVRSRTSCMTAYPWRGPSANESRM